MDYFIPTDYPTLAAQRTARGLRLFSCALTDGAVVRGYAIYACASTFGLTVDVFAGTPEFDAWVANLLPYSTPVPGPQDAMIASIGPAEVYVRQERKTMGHYDAHPLSVVVPAGATRYADYTVPDLTNGIDVLGCNVYGANSEEGDEVATAKVMGGMIAQVAQPAALGDLVVVLAGPRSVLLPQKLGGVLDEGLWLSFGVDTVTAADINAADGSGLNPAPELTEYPIGRILLPATEIGGGNVALAIALGEPLAAALAGGEPANLVQRWLATAGLPMDAGYAQALGDEALTAGNVPANRVLRFGYKNAGLAQKTARAALKLMY